MHALKDAQQGHSQVQGCASCGALCARSGSTSAMLACRWHLRPCASRSLCLSLAVKGFSRGCCAGEVDLHSVCRRQGSGDWPRSQRLLDGAQVQGTLCCIHPVSCSPIDAHESANCVKASDPQHPQTQSHPDLPCCCFCHDAASMASIAHSSCRPRPQALQRLPHTLHAGGAIRPSAGYLLTIAEVAFTWKSGQRHIQATACCDDILWLTSMRMTSLSS